MNQQNLPSITDANLSRQTLVRNGLLFRSLLQFACLVTALGGGSPLALSANAEPAQGPQFFLGAPHYRNRIYTAPPTPPAVQAPAVSVFNGSAEGGVAPTDGVHRLKRSSIGQPIESQSLKRPDFNFGELITPPDGADVSKAPIIDPPAKILYIPGTTPKLIATEPGFVSVTWKNSNGANLPIERYLIANTADKPTVNAYWTEGTTAPKVAFGGLTVTLAHNASLDANSVWIEAGFLHATKKTGLIVGIYISGSGDYVDHELISVQAFTPDYERNVDIGSFLTPENPPVGEAARPIITRGLAPTNDRYAIQYTRDKDPNDGKVMAVRPTLSSEDFEVFWMEQRSQGVEWPFEMARYNADWPGNFETVARRIYWTIDSKGAATTSPGVDLSSAPAVTIFYNPAVPEDIDSDPATKTPALYFRPNESVLQARGRAGNILLMYEKLAPEADGDSTFIGVQLVKVVSNTKDFTDSVAIGSQLLPTDSPADGVLSAAHVGRGLTGEPPYVYQHPTAGPRKGHVWAVRRTTASDQVEVFWRREGLLKALWPYEMHRYSADWPTSAQLFARGHTPDALGPVVPIPDAIRPTLMPWQEPSGHASLSGRDFFTTKPGRSLLRYFPKASDGTDDVVFEVIESVLHTDPRVVSASGNVNIGDEITDSFHARAAAPSNRGGYIHVASDTRVREDRYAPQIYEGADDKVRTGQIFAVNEGTLEVWWSNVKNGVQWPSKVKRYQAAWPASPAQIVIASQRGSGVIDQTAYPDYSLYFQNDASLAGFNPNDEHAFVGALANGRAIFALRNDLGRANTSKPYVLMVYHEPNGSGLWRFQVSQVVAETPQFPFRYSGTAGTLIQPPTPVNLFPMPQQNTGVSGPFWRDRKSGYWAQAAGDDDGTAVIVMHWFYPARDDFFFPEPPADRNAIPWLDGYAKTPGVPINVAYDISWPESTPTLRIGETLVRAKNGLPEIFSQCSAKVLYEQSQRQSSPRHSVRLIHPLRTRSVDLAATPADVVTERISGKVIFTELPPPLRQRLTYDPANKRLEFTGLFVEPPGGNAYLLPNVITARELNEVLLNPSFCGNDPTGAFRQSLQNLGALCAEPIDAVPDRSDPAMSLSSDSEGGQGYVTLAFGDGPGCAPDSPIVVKVIKVECPLYQGQVIPIPSDSPFDEKITMRLDADFAGKSDTYQFEWKTLPALGAGIPTAPPEQWNPFPVANNGIGVNDIHIKGAGLFTLSDNWFVCRYKPLNSAAQCRPGDWSPWTPAQLAEGWVKRVTKKINTFNQRFDDLANTQRTINTIINMISQAGKRWEGDIPLDPANIDKFGLIEIYETIFKRGIEFSVEGTPPINDPGANDALLLAATKLTDLYMLLGNEAYADATDPTIGVGGDGFVQPASSIFCFMNQVPSLLEEELALLRGRDDAVEPSVQTAPFYNRLIWNFSNGDGAVAYALNYGIRDQLGDQNGVINEADAKIMYPQGHGDAWGHYLTATKVYYRLLRSPSYSWVPRAEQILIGGVPVTVDYLDERKFARAAAAKARTGAEVVNLTYRSMYDENPINQWLGYKDKTVAPKSRKIAVNEPRAWGLSEWAIRAGQGAILDWVVCNAILPATDTNHTGLSQVDRSTVTELSEIATHFQEIQAQMDKADLGLNPLGIAKNIVPFDIDPTEIDQGRTHFEQIYNRAVQSLNNAIVVFNSAQNTTQALRRQSDDLANFNTAVTDREADFNSRLIEIYGTPYPEDIGAGGTYAAGYTGPDLYHYMYVDPSELTGTPVAPTQTATIKLFQPTVQPDGSVTKSEQVLTYHFAQDGYGQVKPSTWLGKRSSPGEIQLARSDLIQSKFRFDQALLQYENLYAQLLDEQRLLQQEFNIDAREIQILNTAKNRQVELNLEIKAAMDRQLRFRRIGRAAETVANAIAEALPQSFIAGVAAGGDFTAPARSAIRLSGAMASEAMNLEADQASLDEADYNQAKELAQTQSNIDITSLHQQAGIEQHLAQIQQIVRQEAGLRLEIYTLQESMQQSSARYMGVLARGDRLLEEFTRFRRETAANVQQYRYKDMAFRIFRNDALQKYRAQFDLAAAYVYMTARAFDYETELLDSDPKAGEGFLTSIVRTRAIGAIAEGIPQTASSLGDSGLADPMARMKLNWDSVLKGRLGFNNPQLEQTRFSMRHELFRIPRVAHGDATWRETLEGFRVVNILDIPEFRRNAIFVSDRTIEPGLVIPFSTSIQFGQNFFGLNLAPGDSNYDPSHFATKIRSVGVWFGNYDATQLSVTPSVYLIPAGLDILRSPSGDKSHIREWQIVDEAIPVPFPISSGSFQGSNWIPSRDTLDGSFADIRQLSGFRAYHDGTFDPTQFTKNSRLIGRSVWNTRWLLVIPAGTLGSDRQEALDRFIQGKLVNGQRDGQGVKDILLYFQTYAYSGN